ncbi:MAG: acyl-CoA dehydrogenase [Chloroflexi bacterium]|nr:acyl-CoA dehydrogenase [Chloroflexota bacterium]
MNHPGGEPGMVVAGLLDFVRKAIEPRDEALSEVVEDPRRRYQRDGAEAPELTAARRAARIESAAAGYYQMFCPVELGGGGLGHQLSFLSWEALHHRYGPGELLAYNTISHWANGPSVIWSKASPQLFESVFPRVITGEASGCFGMSEPGAGSDALAMTTRATRDGDTWSITGSKQWTSFSPTADYILLFAVTDAELSKARKGGISCFYVPMGAPGARVESIIRMFGEAGGREAILSFEDVRVPDENRIGELNRGFDLAMLGASQGRLYNSARSVGLGRWALERSAAYAQSRWASGKPIAEYQSIQNMLADMAVEVYAARTMGLDCGARADTGADVRRELAMTKLFATNAAVRAFDNAMQIHGALGLTNELRLHDGWKTVRAIRIADGTDEILRRTIAREVLRGRMDF